MHPEATAELIWHFVGYWHLSEDYSASRLKYEEVAHRPLTGEYQPEGVVQEGLPRVDVASLSTYGIRVAYTPKYDGLEPVDIAKYKVQAADVTGVPIPKLGEIKFDQPAHTPVHSSISSLPSGGIHQVLRQDGNPEEAEPPVGREPIYTIEYTDGLGGQIFNIVQQNSNLDTNRFSDGGEEYASLTHVDTGNAVEDMIDAANEFVPDLLVQPGMSTDHWVTAVAAQEEALESGERSGEALTLGRYVNGELQEDDAPATIEAEEVGSGLPTPPARVEGDTSPGQVAELGGNTANNLALIADINEAPSTLIVMGDYFQTNAIIQANVLQNKDHVLKAGSGEAAVDGGGNTIDNIAVFDAHDASTQSGTAAQAALQQIVGDLKVNIDFVDGDFVDIKALTQRNFLNDGDVTVQTSYDSYAHVMTGANEQLNATRFEDWGKHYDIIIVLGDYHSANIISQTNIVLDNDVVGVSGGAGGSGGGSSVYTGQNALENEASITKYGETTFAGITGSIEELIAALNNQETLDANAWSSFYGAISGSLNVLFVTGDYYDLNVISQINVIADADLAIQVSSGSTLQWISTGGNTATNTAEIIDAGGLHAQYLGGSMYEDSVLVQANLVSDSTHTAQTSPEALVPELVAFIDQSQEAPPSEGETWTSSTYSNHDIFGHVLT